MAWAHAKDLAPHGATAVALTPGWLRSEMMLAAFGVTEANWRDATAAQPHFVISETPRFLGRAVAALAADPDRARCRGQSLSSGELAKVYGFTDLDGSRPGLLALPGRGARRPGARRRHRLPVSGAGAASRPSRASCRRRLSPISPARSFRLLPPGWHAQAVEADDRLVFKFPKGPAAEAALRREAGLLRALRGAVTLPVPELTLHGPPLFSRHRQDPRRPAGRPPTMRG